MKIAIIEDEIPARKHLVALIRKIGLDVQLAFEAPSVKAALAGLELKPDLDLIFMDIQLNDGLSFEIFDYADVKAPIIFTTAYDKYMLDAFQNNGIDYLLKPIKLQDLKLAIEKYQRLGSHFSARNGLSTFAREHNQTFSRIIVKTGVNFKSLLMEELAYFISEHKVTFAVSKDGTRYVVDMPLADLKGRLDGFFRVNRKFLASRDSIAQFRSAGQGKILVDLTPDVKEEVIVSQERAADFKTWITGN